MKTITKNLKHVITGIAFALMMLVSFNVNAQNKKLTDKDISYVKSEFRKGMVSFVESIKPIYKSGMSYDNFKTNLLGKNSTTITTEGDALLKKAYNYISQSTTTAYILKNESGEELASAFRFVKIYNVENKSKKGDLILFGNFKGDTFPSDGLLYKVKECRWYQVFCHLGNFWDWLSSDSDGNGQTNLEDIIEAISILCQIFGC